MTRPLTDEPELMSMRPADWMDVCYLVNRIDMQIDSLALALDGADSKERKAKTAKKLREIADKLEAECNRAAA